MNSVYFADSANIGSMVGGVEAVAAVVALAVGATAFAALVAAVFVVVA